MNQQCLIVLEHEQGNPDGYSRCVLLSGPDSPEVAFSTGDVVRDWNAMTEHAVANFHEIMFDDSVADYMQMRPDLKLVAEYNVRRTTKVVMRYTDEESVFASD